LNQAVGRTEVYGYSPVIVRVGFLAGVASIPLLRFHASWTYLAACLVASTAASAIFSFATMPRASWSGFRLASPAVVALLKYSWTLPFAAVSTYVVNWIDMWVIRAIRGVGSVGVYSWAYQVTAIAGLAFAPVAVVLTPRVIDARLKHEDARIADYVDSILPAAIALAWVIAVAFVFVSPLLTSIVSPAYAAAYPIILILLSALPFQLIAYLVTPLANAYERLIPRIVFASAVIAAINAVGDVILVPRIGIAGAAVATTAAFIVGSLLQVVIVRSEGFRFAPIWKYTVPAGIVLPAAGALHWLGEERGAAFVVIAACAFACAAVYSRRQPIWRTLVGVRTALTLSGPLVPSVKSSTGTSALED
jgi:O-antigen/teichoic acid export membrane protein